MDSVGPNLTRNREIDEKRRAHLEILPRVLYQSSQFGPLDIQRQTETKSLKSINCEQLENQISALNKDVNLVDCAALKATLLAGGRGVRESP